MSDLVTDAVREAFMEVDEEAPGGWQGWRMWNEMVAYENLPVSRPSGSGAISGGTFGDNWNMHLGSTVYETDPVQDATMHLDNDNRYGPDYWNVPGYK